MINVITQIEVLPPLNTQFTTDQLFTAPSGIYRYKYERAIVFRRKSKSAILHLDTSQQFPQPSPMLPGDWANTMWELTNEKITFIIENR